jgi:hypothetical protein
LGRSRWLLILINGCGRAAPKYVVAFSDTIVGAWGVTHSECCER